MELGYYDEVPKDDQNVYVITGFAIVGFFSMHFTGLMNIVRYAGVFVI